MARLTYFVFAVVAINLAMLLFTCPNWDPKTGACIMTDSVYTINGTGYQQVNSTIMDLAYNPTNYESSSFWQYLVGANAGLLAALTGGAILVGSLLFRSDIPFYFGVGISMAYSAQSFARYWQLINGSHVFGANAIWLIATIIVAPMMLLYITLIVEWVGGRN